MSEAFEPRSRGHPNTLRKSAHSSVDQHPLVLGGALNAKSARKDH